ncbi:MAG: hypothetical protein CMD26_04295 [Flavobacteriales bacterium]|nr:hypothetical protein [Flavobacteriales bacterium]
MRYILIYILLISYNMLSQSVTLEVDTNLLRIGEQFNATIKIYEADKNEIFFPDSNLLFQDFELLNNSPLFDRNNQDEFCYKSFLLTSFDTGQFILDSIPVLIAQKDSLFTNAVSVTFLSLPVDTANQFFDIKPPKKISFKLKELMFYLPYLLCVLLLTFIIFLMFKFFKSKEETIVNKIDPEIPIDIYFLDQLKELKSKNYLKNKMYINFYTKLSEIFRGYLELRFNIPALESSTHELKLIIEDLKINKSWMSSFFRTSDIVKFAKGVPSDKEGETSFFHVEKFIKEYSVINEIQDSDEKKDNSFSSSSEKKI